MKIEALTPMLRTWELHASVAFYTEALWQRLKDRARLCYPIETFGYGMREFAIHDNNGYVLQFGQPVAVV